mmetsp:Transcript_21773/g.33633  ORF Transcript_21773/g.33633 Transcript_21773/m.33633 type:complete len:163 (+) Transcript_21773:1765-2253(+)
MSQSFGSGLSPFRKSLASPRDAMCMSNTQTKFEKDYESSKLEEIQPQPNGAGSLPAAERGRIPEISDLKVHGTNAQVLVEKQRESTEESGGAKHMRVRNNSFEQHLVIIDIHSPMSRQEVMDATNQTNHKDGGPEDKTQGSSVKVAKPHHSSSKEVHRATTI